MVYCNSPAILEVYCREKFTALPMLYSCVLMMRQRYKVDVLADFFAKLFV